MATWKSVVDQKATYVAEKVNLNVILLNFNETSNLFFENM